MNFDIYIRHGYFDFVCADNIATEPPDGGVAAASHCLVGTSNDDKASSEKRNTSDVLIVASSNWAQVWLATTVSPGRRFSWVCLVAISTARSPLTPV